jgi:acetamidase/formamidase
VLQARFAAEWAPLPVFNEGALFMATDGHGTQGDGNQAYRLCSLAGNPRVTQLVDGNKGVHMMLAKAHL